MPSRGLTPELLRRFTERAETQCIGSPTPYEPCIRATRDEAPSRSMCAQIPSRLMAREIHALSRTERAAACLALYNRLTFMVMEQRLLSPAPSPHPLHGHPSVMGRKLPSLPGTLSIAEKLGLLDLVPIIERPDPSDPQVMMAVPFPWVGDLLVFLDEADPYALNWNCKRDSTGFRKSIAGPRQTAARAAKIRRDAGRISIEAAYYREAGIPTIEVTLQDFHPQLEANLLRLAQQHHLTCALETNVRDELIDTLRASFDRIPPYDIFTSFVIRHGMSMSACNTAMLQAIWDRKLRVDLYRPILNDQPLLPEQADVLLKFKDWFKRL